jgi:hypothetical protein
MYTLNEAMVAQATHLGHAAAATASTDGGGLSSLVVVAVGGMAVFLTAGIIRTALTVFQALIGAAVRVGMFVLALGFGTLVFAVLYVADMVFHFGPS